MIARKERRRLERRLERSKRRGNMKYLKYDKEFKTANGQPFIIQDPDVKVQQAARDKARAENKEQYQVPTIECDYAQLIIWFVNNIPFDVNEKGVPNRKMTPEDAGHAYATIKAFQNQRNGSVELEDTVYKWLVELNKTDGILAFRPLSVQAIVAERLEDLVKEVKTKD